MSRIPIFAIKGRNVLLAKVVRESKRINSAGLKLEELGVIVQEALPDYKTTIAVIGEANEYDERRRSSPNYNIWLKGSEWPI